MSQYFAMDMRPNLYARPGTGYIKKKKIEEAWLHREGEWRSMVPGGAYSEGRVPVKKLLYNGKNFMPVISPSSDGSVPV